MEVNRDFKGVWIPREIYLATDLNWTEKILLVEIDSLDNEDGCFASNEYFGKFLGIAKTNASKAINSLINKGYVISNIVYKENSKEVDKRILHVTDKLFMKLSRGYRQERQGGIDKNVNAPIDVNVKGGIDANVKDNNISFNNTSINNTSYIKDILSIDNAAAKKEIALSKAAKEIIDYLNAICGTKYKATTPKTKSLISTRMKEGFTIEDFKKVIVVKFKEWGKDQKMSKFLRPETLFSNKFEGYLNQYKGENLSECNTGNKQFSGTGKEGSNNGNNPIKYEDDVERAIRGRKIDFTIDESSYDF